MRPPRRFQPIGFQISAAANRWQALARAVRAAAREPGYTGPDPAEIERIAGEIAALRPAAASALITAADAVVAEVVCSRPAARRG